MPVILKMNEYVNRNFKVNKLTSAYLANTNFELLGWVLMGSFSENRKIYFLCIILLVA